MKSIEVEITGTGGMKYVSKVCQDEIEVSDDELREMAAENTESVCTKCNIGRLELL